MIVDYHFVSQLDGPQLGSMLLRSVSVLHTAGFTVRGIVCDGAPTNIAAYRSLLASKLVSFRMKANGEAASDDMTPVMQHPITGEDIFLMLDSSHMIKNAR